MDINEARHLHQDQTPSAPTDLQTHRADEITISSATKHIFRGSRFTQSIQHCLLHGFRNMLRLLPEFSVR